MTEQLTVTPDTFQAELDKHAGQQIIVDFWASWCGPCRMVGPILEKIDTEENTVTVLKIDVDANPEISAAFGIQSIPTMLFFKDGEMNKTPLVGAVPKDTILSHIK
jgi:thioredoxin 1